MPARITPHPEALEIGKRVEVKRLANGWTLDDLGNRCRPLLHKGHLSHIERGLSIPNAITLRSIAKALGSSADWLLGIETTPRARK